MTLQQRGADVAVYVWQPDTELALAPRPYAHPVRTLAGTVVTEAMPGTHRHHLGLSIAVPDVGGHNFWGGRTFLPGHGPAWLDNHGRQRHLDWHRRDPGTVSHRIAWTTADGRVLLHERRTLTARPVTADSWVLDVHFTLTNVGTEPLSITSPAVHGRDGAGYGGFFWRAPVAAGRLRAFGPAAEGTDALHGTRSPWLALARGQPGGPGWTLVFAGADDRTRQDPWFVRTRDYPGVGSALAWHHPLTIAPADTAGRRIVTVVADGVRGPREAAELAAAAQPAATS